VVVDDFYTLRFAFVPDEADAILVVDTNALLSLAVALKLLKTIVYRSSKIVWRDGRVNTVQKFGSFPVQLLRQSAPSSARGRPIKDIQRSAVVDAHVVALLPS
jgi:hypothetical protein